MKAAIEELKKKNVEAPTAERKSWLVWFDFHVRVDNSVYDCEIETEWENPDDFYILTIKLRDGKEIGKSWLDQTDIDSIKSEAKATVDAYGIFKFKEVTEESEREDGSVLQSRHQPPE